MEYQYETEKLNYEDLSSGRVLYNAPGTTAFPVRLASELLQRCFGELQQQGSQGPYTVYDPCCGGGYTLTVAGLLHGGRIAQLWGSDIDPQVLDVAAKNLSLLHPAGMEARSGELRRLLELYGKPSHEQALLSAARLAAKLDPSAVIETAVFQRDAASDEPRQPGSGSMPLEAPDIVMADLPYGQIVSWSGASTAPLAAFFAGMHALLAGAARPAVLCVVADKSQKLSNERFKRLQYSKIGKRHFAIFEAVQR